MTRPPGEVRDAIIAVLAQARGPMGLAEIHKAVEQRLGGAVAPSSVRSYLQIGSTKHFERVGKGTYRSRAR